MTAATSELGTASPEGLPRSTGPSVCAVCEAPASYRHFGNKPICKSCAAFFRRTVALNVAHKCRTRGQCSLGPGRPSRACKLCRFRKCVAAGMSVNAVISSPQTGAAQTPLDRLVHARKAVYINRFRETSELCAKLQMRRQASLSMTTQACDVAIQAEFLVVSDFLKRSDFLDVLTADSRGNFQRIAFSFLSTWNIYEWMLTTIRNFGHYSRRLFFLDESYLDLSEAAISEYYATDSDLLDPWHVGRLGVSSFVDILEVSRKLARARLDEVESAVLTLVLFVRSVKGLLGVDGIRLGPLLDVVFRNLALHYRQTYEDYALRLDVIVHMADEIQRIRHVFDEHSIMLRLYGRTTMMSRIEHRVRQWNPTEIEDSP